MTQSVRFVYVDIRPPLATALCHEFESVFFYSAIWLWNLGCMIVTGAGRIARGSHRQLIREQLHQRRKTNFTVRLVREITTDSEHEQHKANILQ